MGFLSGGALQHLFNVSGDSGASPRELLAMRRLY